MDRRALLPAAVVLLMVAVAPTARARPAPTGMTPFSAATPASVTTQPAGRLATLIDPADGVLQPQPDGPYALLTFQRPDRAAARALGGDFAAVGSIVADGTGLGTTASIFEDTDTLQVVLDPCALTNPDDLPGRTIRLSWAGELVTVTRVAPAEEMALVVGEFLRRETDETVLTLGPDTRAPELRVVSPTSGMRVRAGETVEIVLHADEPDNLGVWQTGVNRIELLNPDGDREERIISRGGPRTCGDKVREGEATFTYRVPRDAQPGRTLDFVVDAYDWANNRLSRSLTLIVEEEVWEGTWRGTEETFVPPGGGRFVRSNTALDGTFTFRVSPDNTIRGEAMATVAYQLESGEFCTTRINLPPTMIALEVHGRRAGEQFELELRPRAGAALRYTRVDRCPPDAPPETSEPNWLDEGFLGAIGRATMPARDGAEMEFPVTTIPEQTVRYRVTLRQRR